MTVQEAKKIAIRTLIVLAIVGGFTGGIAALIHSDNQDKANAETGYCTPKGLVLDQRVYEGGNHWLSICKPNKNSTKDFILVDEATGK